MKHFHKPLWNHDSEALKSSSGLLPASKGSELCLPIGMKDGSIWLGHTSWERNRKDSDLSSLQSANPARSGSHLLILNKPLWEVKDFPTPLFSLLLQPCTFPVTNAIKKLSIASEEEKVETTWQCPASFPFRVTWRHMTSSPTPQESRESGFSNTYGEPQIVFQLARHASSLQVPGPARPTLPAPIAAAE